VGEGGLDGGYFVEEDVSLYSDSDYSFCLLVFTLSNLASFRRVIKSFFSAFPYWIASHGFLPDFLIVLMASFGSKS